MESTSTATVFENTFSWASTTSWSEIATFITTAVVLYFGFNEYVAPRLAKFLFSIRKSWPAKVQMADGRVYPDGGIRAIITIAPRRYTITDRHEPRLINWRASIRAISASGEILWSANGDFEFVGNMPELSLDYTLEKEVLFHFPSTTLAQLEYTYEVSATIEFGYRRSRHKVVRSDWLELARDDQ